ncbi:hypothetical protein [Flexithrix dorotheae]|uniref:hypothetical protein n=1 Tax=Flexithrix dorotheae TaxID=70993 RepID=UPI00037E438B|nr:hypothetical protein [Flexithrix dorotheae]
MKKAIILILFSLFCISLNAQKLIIGNGISTLIKAKNSNKPYQKTGFGINTNLEYELSEKLAITGEASWNSWGSRIVEDPKNSVSLMAGIKVNPMRIIYFEARTGYFFGDLEKYALIPAIGARFNKFDLNAGYQVSGLYNFANIRVTYFWK